MRTCVLHTTLDHHPRLQQLLFETNKQGMSSFFIYMSSSISHFLKLGQILYKIPSTSFEAYVVVILRGEGCCCLHFFSCFMNIYIYIYSLFVCVFCWLAGGSRRGLPSPGRCEGVCIICWGCQSRVNWRRVGGGRGEPSSIFDHIISWFWCGITSDWGFSIVVQF